MNSIRYVSSTHIGEWARNPRPHVFSDRLLRPGARSCAGELLVCGKTYVRGAELLRENEMVV